MHLSNFRRQVKLKLVASMALIVFVMCSLDAISQDDELEDSQTNTQMWLDFYPHFFITEKWQFYGDLGFRTILGENDWRRFHIRPSVRYHFSDYIQFRGGIGMFYVDSKTVSNSFEFSPWQGVHARWPRFDRLFFTHFFRVEERSIWELDSDEAYSFELRMRYKLSGTILLCKPCGDQYWSIPFFVEQFFPVAGESNEIYRNRTRLGFGVSYKRSKRWQYELNYVWQRDKGSVDQDFEVEDNIIQFKVKKRIIKPKN